jgi:hypothetical protein
MPEFGEMLAAASNMTSENVKQTNMAELHRDFFISPSEKRDDIEELEETNDGH